MKKILCMIVALMLVLTVVTSNVAVHAGTLPTGVVEVLTGDVGVTNFWDGGVEREADGTSLIIGPAGDDGYGYTFNNLEPGIYKLAFYLSIEGITTGKHANGNDQRLRVKTTSSNKGMPPTRTCWVDFNPLDITTESGNMKALYDAKKDGDGVFNVIFVIVINVAADNNRIRTNTWQEANTFRGLLDYVVLAKGDYKFENTDGYYLVAEIPSTGEFNEDQERKLNCTADDFTASDVGVNAVSGVTGVIEAYKAVDETGGDGTEPIDTEEPGDTAEPTDGEGSTVGGGTEGEAPETERGKSSQTGDVSVALAMITSVAAVFGGLQLRKNKK